MNKIALRAAIATALIAPAVVLGAGAASAAPTVTNPSADDVAPFEAEVNPGLGVCSITGPSAALALPFSTTKVTGTAATDVVKGMCFGLPYFYSDLGSLGAKTR